MSDVETLFRQLVKVLVARDPDAVFLPFQIAELYQDLAPYRGVRRELGFEAVEDYEMAVLRLLAGEGDFVSIDPPEVQQALLEESESVNPHPGAFREYAAAYVHLARRAVTRVLEPDDAYAPPPPPSPLAAEREELEGWEEVETGPGPAIIEPHAVTDEQMAAALEQDLEEAELDETVPVPALDTGGELDADPDAPTEPRGPVFESLGASGSSRCPDCNAALPRGRRVVFCPYCAKQLEPARCRQCGDDIEPGWQYCVTCGHPATA